MRAPSVELDGGWFDVSKMARIGAQGHSKEVSHTPSGATGSDTALLSAQYEESTGIDYPSSHGWLGKKNSVYFGVSFAALERPFSIRCIAKKTPGKEAFVLRRVRS